MKKKWLILFSIFALSLFFVGCKDDGTNIPNVTSDPGIVVSSEKIHTVQGRVIRMEGLVQDEVGLKSINLKNEKWFLDKTISFSIDSLVKSYSLWYDFKVPSAAPNSDDEVIITVTNVGGRTITKKIAVKMDGDFVLPVMAVNSPIDGLTVPPVVPNPVNISCSLSDSRRLGYFVVREAKLNFYDSISFQSGITKDYQYAKTINLSGGPQSYQFFFTVADSAGNVVNKTSIVKVSADFDKMYLSDVMNEADLLTDLFGVPMVIDKKAPFTFQAKYYAEKANTEIKFIPQKTSFSPHCYGVDPNNAQKLINSPSLALPIVLPQKGYYKIDINLETME